MPEPIPDVNRDQTCHHYQAPTGQRCGSPALKGQYYCYHHHITNANRGNRRVLIDPEITCMEIPPIEDRASIFIALAAVVHRLAENTIDTRRAGQMIYGLQVAMQALPPVQAPRPQSDPPSAVAPESESRCAAEPATANSALQPATSNQQPATSPVPATIPISKESLLYFLRSRHCASCNAELFPADELTERPNAGAPPQVIEEAHRALPAPQPAPDNLQPETVLSSLQAVTEGSIAHSPALPPDARFKPATCKLQLTTGCTSIATIPPSSEGKVPQSTFSAPFALHSPRRYLSWRLGLSARRIPGSDRTRPHRIMNQ